MRLLLLLLLAPACALAGTYTAASCSQSDVNAVINGPTHTAVDGDVIIIPGTSCTWASGVVVPSNIGITITGTGTPNSGSGTTVPSSSCTATNITVSSGATLFTMSPEYGNSTTRISCMTITSGTGSGIFISGLGTCTSSGCPSIRSDNITYASWAGHVSAGISYGINAVGGMFGVFDHNTVNGSPGNYLQLVEVSNAGVLGVGQYGDNSWHLLEGYGSANFLFFENNTFNTAGCCENEGTAGSQVNQGGGGVVVRYNQFANMDNLNFSMGWHGTESNGRPRSVRTWEYYGNTWTVTSGTPQVAGVRGGTGLTWGNTANVSGGAISSLFTLTTYRTTASIGGWGACDGSSAYDTNDGITYYSGTIGSISGSDPYTITVSGASPGWTTNQWVPNGAPYSIHDVTQSNGWEIASNTANTLTTTSGGGPGTWTPANGDSIQILRATICIDQSGGRGAGILYSGSTATPVSSANEVPSPTYLWSNTLGASPAFALVSSDTGRVIANRDYYTETLNQTAQTSPTSPFSGTGIGHGTLANRPVTCTASTNSGAVGSAYWETDHSQLDYCTATNTWSTLTSSPQSYVPYTYPHPLDSGSSSTVATPTASPAAGTYSSTQSVTLSTATGGATICFTTDGTTPTAVTAGTCSHGSTYSTAISVSTSETIKAIGTLSGYTNSGVLTATYTITPPSTCQVLGPSSGCPCGAQSPCLQTYVSTLTTQLTSLIPSPTPPPLTIAVAIIPASAGFRAGDSVTCYTPTNNCIYSTAGANSVSKGLNAYFNNALKPSGATVVIHNFDTLYATAASQYTGGCTAAHPADMTWQLSQDLLMLQTIQAAGFKIWLSASPLTDSFTACGYTVGSVSSTQYTTAINPMVQAYIAYMAANGVTISAIAYAHEVQGYNLISTGNASPYTTAQWTALLSSGCAAVHAATGGSGVRCGGGFTVADNTYSAYYFAHATADDQFWDAETYGTYNGYASQISTTAALCATAIAAGMTCESFEGNPPVWGSGTSESTAYAGCTWDTGTSGWVSYNQIGAWANVTARALSAAGFSSFTYYGTQPMGLLLSSQTPNCYNSDSGDATYQVMQSTTGSTSALTEFKSAISWAGEIGGTITITHVVVH